MWNKKQESGKGKKLKAEIVELICLSFIISVFFFLFLDFTSASIADTYLESREIVLTSIQERTLDAWMKTVCFLACVILFHVLFLVLFGQKISYLLLITDGIRKLQENQMDFVIQVEGTDELAELAESINFLSKSQRELQRKERELKEEREALIRSLSHDICTPLTSILSYSEYMGNKNQFEEGEVRECFALIHKKAEQIQVLSGQLLGKEMRRPELVENGLLLIEQMAAEWEESLEDSFVCELDFSQCKNFQIYADINEMRRIFDNLLTNVEKYASPAVKVELAVKTVQDNLVVTQRNKKKAPEKGVESHKVGMTSMKGIVKNYGGTVEVSETEDSFQIEISLPLFREL